VTGAAAVVLAPNPGPMTLDGTNTWVLRSPSSHGCVVVDPGPLHEQHLAEVAACGPVEVVLLTHGHLDHSEGAARFAELVGADVRALDPAHRLGEQGLAEGDVVAAAGVELHVLHTPGHTSDSLSFVLRADGERDAVLTGDTVLGRGTTVVAHPDGVLADYLASLRRLRAFEDATVLPGHGPELASAGEAAERYLAHREQRLEQVRAAVAAGAADARAVVETVYADVDPVLWDAAELSVRAQLAYLRGERA
jgi:glyoxylase-like metal-dependent hydrolase (beta-lactamase superfamily II)